MKNVINLAEHRAARAKARHVIGQCAAVMRPGMVVTATVPGLGYVRDVTDDADRLLRAHLLQEAFAEQELAGVEFNFEAARKRADEMLALAYASIAFHDR